MKVILFSLLFYLIKTTDFKCEEQVTKRLKEHNLIELLSNNIEALTTQPKCIEHLLSKGYYKAAEYLIEELNKKGLKVKDNLNNAISNIKKNLEDLYNLYKFDDKDFQLVSPAVQWAQNLEDVFIEIKFAHRWDSPGCLEVKNESLEIYKNLLVFQAFCVQGDTPIKFDLSLQLFDEADKANSTWFYSSVGRFQIRLRKSKPEQYWKHLLEDPSIAPSNMKVWFEMREKYKDELKSFHEEEDRQETEKLDEEIRTYRAQHREKTDL